jgi:tetratricopeptide (TPR) repeat protein
MRAIVDRFPDNQDMRERLGAALDSLASIHLSTQENARAVPLLQESIALYESRLAAHPDDAAMQDAVAGAYSSLTRAQSGMGDNAAAMASVDKALKPLRRIYEAETSNHGSLHGLGATLILKGDLLTTAKRYEEAQAVCEEVIGLYRRGLETSPDDRVFHQMLVVSYGGLAAAHEKQNELTEAMTARETGLSIVKTLVEADPDNQQLRAGLAFMQMQAAQTHNLLGQHARALELTDAAIEVFDGMLASGAQNPASLGWIIEAREHHVRALDGLIIDPATSDNDRQRLRAGGRDCLTALRGNYRRLRQLDGSTDEALAASLAKVDELDRNLADDGRIGAREGSP